MPFNPVLPKFESTPGPINPIPDSRKDCVYTYFSNIVTETNRYARQTLESTDITDRSRLNSWKDVISEDIYLALTILIISP